MDTPGPFEKRANESYFYVTPPEKRLDGAAKGTMAYRVQLFPERPRLDHEVIPATTSSSSLERLEGDEDRESLQRHFVRRGLGPLLRTDDDRRGFGGAAPNANHPRTKSSGPRNTGWSRPRPRCCGSAGFAFQSGCIPRDVGRGRDKIFPENCFMEEKPARAEAMRGTFDLGYGNYSLGNSRS